MFIIDTKEHTIEIQLDWRGYFLDFCEKHGDPVLYKGRLLFGDGWMYSSTDYKGPEWQPDQDPKQRRKDRLWYWGRRLQNTRTELRQLEQDRNALYQDQSARSCTLRQWVRVTDADGNKKTERIPLDLGIFDERIEWLKLDLNDCLTKIKEIQGA